MFCGDEKQRRIPENKHELQMPNEDYAFHKDQTRQRVGKCVDAVIPLSLADRQMFRRLRHSQPQSEAPTCSSSGILAISELASSYGSDSSSTLTDKLQSSAVSKFVPDSMSLLNQNRKKWTSLAKMS